MPSCATSRRVMADTPPSLKSWKVAPCKQALAGALRVPGDKSVSHRAVMFASLADGVSHIRGFLEGEDTRATARVMQQMGVAIDTPAYGERRVHGVGLNGLTAPNAALDCGNSGTAMRLLSGVLAGQSFSSVLVGDASLSRRPMHRIAAPLRDMGARISLSSTDTAPIEFSAADKLQGIRYRCPVASAQVKSAVLLAGLFAEGTTEVVEPVPTRNYTEVMLAEMGAAIEYGDGFARLQGGSRLQAMDVEVPADFSSAAFAIVAACLVPGSHLRLTAVGMNPRRTGLLDVLRMMGARIDITPVQGRTELFDIDVQASALSGVDVPVETVPDMIDEFPILFVAAACATGITRVRGAAELRVKESDRIAKMAEGLRTLGVRVEETADGADIHGSAMHGGRVDTDGDHRIAMAFAVAGLLAKAPVRIEDVGNVETSYPGFVADFSTIGANIEAI